MPPEFDGDADAYLDFALAEVLPEAAAIAEAADVFLERGAFDAAQARRYLEACRDAGLALRLHGDQFTELGAIPLAIELGARSVDHLEATGADGVRALAASDVVGVAAPGERALPRPADAAGARARRRGRRGRARDRLQPRQRVLREPAALLLARGTQLKLSPAEALAACTVNAAHVLGRADRLGRLAPGYRADVVLLDAPDWRYLAYHLGGDVVDAGRARGRPASYASADADEEAEAPRARRRSGTSTSSSTSTTRATRSRSRRRSSTRRAKAARTATRRPPQQKAKQPPPKARPRRPRAAAAVLAARRKRGAILGVVVFVIFSFGASRSHHGYISRDHPGA